MQDIVLENVTKQWPGSSPALDHLDLTARAGEILGVVGPSGCGKTTALRVIGGFETPTSGRVLLGPRDITRLASRDRHFGLITQQNQLLSHLSAARNISFPLEVRGMFDTASDIDRRLSREAERLGIVALLERRPTTLSEGERRLVQLARAVIGAPVALLMDEPLAFLEDQVRLRVRSEILRVHRDRSLTSIFVTASQQDAMAICDRIAVLIEGRLEQHGTPIDIYDRPATADVAMFFGEPAMNVMPAIVDVSGASRSIGLLDRTITLETSALDVYHGREVLVGIRPEELLAGASIAASVPARVETTESLGFQTQITATTAAGTVLNCVIPGIAPRVGTVLDLGIPADRVHLFDPATRMAIHHPLR